ncbi:hypothetical protein [Mycolicibacterium rhodesiae]|uniref:hypothetical protein n=1 Tax=Mycolicibacterium rhodesiae TaxID=36814 RepID=UPI001055E9D8|nr:hypothetical protein [Mycolicibacterium rhodesiae]MCV7344907.1 hypothetical protein [Mycolicibacterium rhodesiae]
MVSGFTNEFSTDVKERASARTVLTSAVTFAITLSDTAAEDCRDAAGRTAASRFAAERVALGDDPAFVRTEESLDFGVTEPLLGLPEEAFGFRVVDAGAGLP